MNKKLRRIANTTTFGGRKLLGGSSGTNTFQAGAAANENISSKTGEMSSRSLKGDIYRTTFKLTDLGLNKGADTDFKVLGWSAGWPYSPHVSEP